ncbi:MAG: geranylgeranyl reductase family protein [Pseudodesulfovibrio sp.]|nr:geranylgeranyl reductase family protein [Pseudodesulfovibrio sp.]
MRKKFDVIICGCGLAGCAAGLSLARRGHSVAMLDRARFPRRKLCGGLLTWKSVKLLESLFGETPESLIQAGAINFISDKYAIRTFATTLASGDLSFPFHFVDRSVFDNHLLSSAVAAGAEVFQKMKVVSCDPVQGLVTCENGDVFQGDHVIGADGANSVVRGSFPNYSRERFKRFMAPTIEIALDRKDYPRSVEYPELYVGFMDAGYGWVFPNRNKIVLGICGLRQKDVNFSQLFESYLDFLKVDRDRVPDLHGHPLPYGNYLENPVHGVTLLAGDAGGFVEPLLGEGIFFALCTGMYAGEAVAQGIEKATAPGPIYTQRLFTHIMPELKGSDRLRWALFKGMKYLGPSSLGWFINLGSTRLSEMVHGIRSYSWLRKKHWDF